jgi:acetyl/propionyl-CoA carboxylase alpha subunit
MGFVGPKFTWSNRQDVDTHVKVRLDRAVANDGFSRLFEDSVVENLITTSSDHYAILITLDRASRQHVLEPVQHNFKFEAMWLQAPDYTEVLEKAWPEGREGFTSLQATWSNLHRVASSLKDWSRAMFGSVRRKIQKLEGRLRYIRGQTQTGDSIAEEREAERELSELFEREEIMARQRS